MVRDILATGTTLSTADVAELAGVKPRTVQRVKKELNGAAK
jgi:DNA-binding transcriptional regulator YhcF (GntR family)